ncbi:DUF1853 family protein [Parahaliea sp. F7430]|uniref:DUF1853 family protein n=1 Tax=Sediminihaliea albiluteola TaxID=2758564 RepID=A0A7W2TU34_9GAMM|nr:DUF1853 family protein [Sediminihaliea albiluteola]MBA6411976.1 DUF1853 family protein [Sediminihaliea albiluteola]
MKASLSVCMTPQHYRQQAVRDLAWACFSPPIVLNQRPTAASREVVNTQFQLSAERLSWLQALDKQPDELLAFLAAAPSRRLGLYFERLWHFFLGQDPLIDLVANNLPVYNEKRTIGEFDCLYYCHQRRQHVHLELAVKFYLSYGSLAPNKTTSHSYQWLGPNNRDRLDIKTERLMQHQIRLSERPQAKALLRELGIDSLLREVDIKGYLFQSASSPLPPPEDFNPQRQLCRWYRCCDLPTALDANTLYIELERLRWLSPAVAQATDTKLSRKALVDTLQAHFSEQQRPRLIAELDPEGREQRRFFVVNADWPN